MIVIDKIVACGVSRANTKCYGCMFIVEVYMSMDNTNFCKGHWFGCHSLGLKSKCGVKILHTFGLWWLFYLELLVVKKNILLTICYIYISEDQLINRVIYLN